jgi:hypothetical protein
MYFFYTSSLDTQYNSFKNFPELGGMITGMYIDILLRLWDAVRRKRPVKWRTSRILLRDNAPAHLSVLVKDFLAKNNVTTQELLFTHPLQ